MITLKNTQTFALNIGYKPSLLCAFADEFREKLNDNKSITQQRKSLAGSLSKYADPNLIEKEKDIAWELVAKEKLEDDVKFKDQAKEYLETYDIYIKNEVFAEVVYVLNKTYNIPKSELCKVLKELLNYDNIYMESKDVTLLALEIFETTNIDFVDSLLCSYNRLKNLKIITFDKKLKNCIEEKKI